VPINNGQKFSHCRRCFYPFNAKPTITFDSNGICSGCSYHENRTNLQIDWEVREHKLRILLEAAKSEARQRGAEYDCLIPVSGGKDSHFQVWLMTEVYGMNPLLVHFNHGFNSPAGLRNLRNLVKKSGLKLITKSTEPAAASKLAKTMIEKVGDLTWHYHAGIMTAPFTVAVEYEIPLLIWGEHGFGELTGLVSLLDFPEFTNWKRKEHDMRGIDPKSLIGVNGINESEIEPFLFPKDEDMDRLNVRGIYLSSYIEWDALSQAQLMIDKWNFSGIRYKRDRTFNLYSKIEDHANDVHDFMKYLKFGYGRATDDVSMEIRHGRISRRSGLEIIEEYDAVVPKTLEYYCDLLEITRLQFFEMISPMRDTRVWEINSFGNWELSKEHIEQRRKFIETSEHEEIVFQANFKDLYFNPNNPPNPSSETELNLPIFEPLPGN
jgi:N-acetyl sugar amidotransferase